MERREARAKFQPAFQAFFEAYPRKVDFAPAFIIFLDLMQAGVDPQMLIAKAKSYSQNVGEIKYVPSPKAWLRDQKWEDNDLFTDQHVNLREWFIGCWKRGDARAVVDRYGFLYSHPAVPDDVEDLETWHLDQRKAWVGRVARHVLHGEGLPE